MPSRNLILPVDDAEVFAGIVIPEKDAFTGVLTAEQVAQVKPENIPLLLGISRIEQWSDWQNTAIELLSAYVVILYRRRKAERNLGIAFLKWIATTIGAGLVAGCVTWLFRKIK